MLHAYEATWFDGNGAFVINIGWNKATVIAYSETDVKGLIQENEDVEIVRLKVKEIPLAKDYKDVGVYNAEAIA